MAVFVDGIKFISNQYVQDLKDIKSGHREPLKQQKVSKRFEFDDEKNTEWEEFRGNICRKRKEEKARKVAADKQMEEDNIVNSPKKRKVNLKLRKK